MKKRLLIGIALVLTLGCVVRAALPQPRPANAFASDFSLGPLDCNSVPGHVTIVNTSVATSTLDQVTLSVTSTGSGGTTLTRRIIDTVLAPGTPGGNYAVVTGGLVNELIGPGAAQAPGPAPAVVWPANPPTTFANPQNLLFSASSLLTPGAIIVLSDATSGATLATAQCPAAGARFVFFVSPRGFDTLPSGAPNPACASDLPNGIAPTDANPGPCLTIQHALDLANDGQTILVEAGNYEICTPIQVTKLVRITNIINASDGTDVNPATPVPVGQNTATSGNAITRGHVVLHSFGGDTIFHVTAIGYPSVNSPSNFPNAVPAYVPPNTAINNNYHVLIDGFTMGGSFKPGAAAIFLDNDSNTDVRNNIIGGESFANPFYTGVPCAKPPVFPPLFNPTTYQTQSLGNATGIMLQNSDHANIFNNAILGSSTFPFVPVLTPSASQPQTGFAIVTTECLGLGADASDGAQIMFNLINKNANAGIWLCSDGGGGHLMGNNTVRNNGRGILLRSISDTLLDADTVSDNFQDAIVIYDAASNNTVQRSLIESQSTPGAAGIRLGGFGSGLFPLQTAVINNTLRRNWADIVVAGARNTSGSGNIITSESIRTAILVQVGSAGAPLYTQPSGTAFHLNQIVSNGLCHASQGCAIRLDLGVTADVDATQNNFGLPASVDVNTVLWHKQNDVSLGFVNASQATVPVSAAPLPGVGAPGAVGGGLLASPAAGSALPSVAGPATGGAGAGTGAGATLPPASTPIAVPTPAGTVTPARPGPGATTNSPALSSGAAGGTTAYSPPCSFVPVPASVGASITPAAFLSLFQPVANLYSAWKFDNSTHFFQPIYFADPGAPVAAVTLRPGDIVSLCITDNVQGPP